MAKQKKRPELKHCKVSFIKHPKAPWRVSWPVEKEGQVSRVFKRLAGEDAALAEIGATVPSFQDLVTGALADIRRRHAELAKNSVPVAEAVAVFMASREKKGGTRYRTDLKTRLKRFAQDFGDRPLRSITSAEIETWLAALRSRKNPDKLDVPPLLAPLSRNHYRSNLQALFAFGVAPSRCWCDENPVAAIDPEEVKREEPKAYSPEDAALVMQAALDSKPDLVPVLALGFFAGLRVSEALEIELGKLPLDDEDEDGFKVSDGKTGNRVAPLTPACRAWLTAQTRRKGKAWLKPERKLVDEMQELFRLAGVEQIDNGARHSFISYRCAETRDVAGVSDECGNSVQTIKNHYREITTRKVAAKFFAIRPAGTAANVTHIQEGRASA